MRYGWTCLLALVMCFGVALSTDAKAEAEVELSGTLTCAMCDLEQAKRCTTVLLVGEGDAEVMYTLANNKITKGAHKRICKVAIDGVKVVGAVSEKDGGKIITPSKVTFPEKK